MASIYALVQDLPPAEKFGLRSQLTTAAVSVPANTAVGCSRTSAKDYRRFLETALGSLYELETLVLVLDRVEFLDAELKQSIRVLIDEEQRMVSALMRKLSEG